MSYDVCFIFWFDFDVIVKVSFMSVNYRFKMSYVFFICVIGNRMDQIKKEWFV